MVFKIEKTKNYTVMSNYHLRDKNLSLKAKGLLSFMLSLPDDWDYSINGLVAICKEEETAIKTALKELQKNNYLKINKLYPNETKSGKIEYEYIIYEEPYLKEKEKEQEVENLSLEIQCVENDGQINIKETNIKEKIDKTDKIDKTINDSQNSSYVYDNNYSQLTNDLVKRGYIDQNDTEKVYYDNLFNEVLLDNDFKDIVIISHYVVSRVVGRKFRDEDNNIIENKFGYYKEALLSNIRKFKNNELIWDDEFDWVKDTIEEKDLFDDYYDYEKFNIASIKICQEMI